MRKHRKLLRSAQAEKCRTRYMDFPGGNSESRHEIIFHPLSIIGDVRYRR